VNNRMMRFGAVMYDSWWIFVLAMLVGGGIGWAVQSLQPVWLAWVLGMTFSAGMAMVQDPADARATYRNILADNKGRRRWRPMRKSQSTCKRGATSYGC